MKQLDSIWLLSGLQNDILYSLDKEFIEKINKTIQEVSVINLKD